MTRKECFTSIARRHKDAAKELKVSVKKIQKNTKSMKRISMRLDKMLEDL